MDIRWAPRDSSRILCEDCVIMALPYVQQFASRVIKMFKSHVNLVNALPILSAVEKADTVSADKIGLVDLN